MNLRLTTLLFVLGVLFMNGFVAVAAAQNDDSNSRVYETDTFDRLFLEGAFNVELIQGKRPSVKMQVSDPKAFDYLKLTNENGMLHVHVDRKPFDLRKITLYITFDELNWMRIFGSIRLQTKGYLDLDEIEMTLEGGARINFQAKADVISIVNKGGVMVELSGVTDVLDVYMAGAGHINAGELKAKDVDFRIDGVGTGKVYATRSLNATIKGAGKISYKGDPEVKENIEGLGSVSQE